MQVQARNEQQECLNSMLIFQSLYKSISIGELVRLCQQLSQNLNVLDDGSFAQSLVEYISISYEQNKRKQQSYEYLSLIATESLIFNLYRNFTKNGINNSLYNNSLLMSSAQQISIDHSIASFKQDDFNEDAGAGIVIFLDKFVADEKLLKKLKLMVERKNKNKGDNDNANQRYAEILFETIEYILNKEGKLPIQASNAVSMELKQNNFYATKNKIVKSPTLSSQFQKRNIRSIILDVNKILFSSKMNRIILFLTNAEERVYFSLLRIYFAESSSNEQEDPSSRSAQPKRKTAKTAKYFRHCQYSGQEMMLNLQMYYISSINHRSELFESSKNPLYILVASYLTCFFMPIFRDFSQIVIKCCKLDFDDASDFYRVSESIINKDLSQFIDNLPEELVQYLHTLYKMTMVAVSSSDSKKESNMNNCLSVVKKLLFYSFLFKSELIESFFSSFIDLEKYESACNHLINLFFKSSLKKGPGLATSILHQGGKNQLVTELTNAISHKIDQKIMSFQPDQEFNDFEGIGMKNYVLEQPILNNDYEILWEVINKIEFTPKDLKQFEMKKLKIINDNYCSIYSSSEACTRTLSKQLNQADMESMSPQIFSYSPSMQRNKNSLEIMTESLEMIEHSVPERAEDKLDQIDFITWMTVGGSRNYTQDSSTEGKASEQKNGKENRVKSFQFETFPTHQVKQVERLYLEYTKIME